MTQKARQRRYYRARAHQRYCHSRDRGAVTVGAGEIQALEPPAPPLPLRQPSRSRFRLSRFFRAIGR